MYDPVGHYMNSGIFYKQNGKLTEMLSCLKVVEPRVEEEQLGDGSYENIPGHVRIAIILKE